MASALISNAQHYAWHTVDPQEVFIELNSVRKPGEPTFLEQVQEVPKMPHVKSACSQGAPSPISLVPHPTPPSLPALSYQPSMVWGLSLPSLVDKAEIQTAH